MTPRLVNPYAKTAFLLFAFAAMVLSQLSYDAVKKASPVIPATGAVSPELVRMADMGFHSTVASALWITTLPEILDFFHGRPNYLTDLSYLNAIDPKLSYPYAYSVLVLPSAPDKSGLAESFTIGEKGLADADPDWRIAYYMATNYFVEKKDTKDAIWYYNIAAQTPGIPQYAERFALNFGIGTNQRAKVEELWATIRDSTNDEGMKERAQAYIDRLQSLDYLETAAKVYKKRFGSYPTSTDALVGSGIIPSVPVDPFGFTFLLNKDGAAGIDLNKLPSYISSEPQN